MKKIAAAFFLLIAAASVIFITDQQHLYKTIWYNYPGIYDDDIFDKRAIRKSSEAVVWPISSQYNKQPISDTLLHALEYLQTAAYLIIDHDSVITEKYWGGTNEHTHSNSFSVSKSFVGALVGRALKLGYIKSLDQKAAEFIPEFKIGERQHITIRHLLTMSSGLDWDEAYSSLLSQTTKAYYGTDLRKQMLALNTIKKPGMYFEYKSCDTELLAMILVKATGMTLSDFFQKELWQPIGAEEDAYWSLDNTDGFEKAYCCIYSDARDFAKLARLYMHEGNWNGVQLIDSAYVHASVMPSFLKDPLTDAATDCYGYQWWTIPDYKGYNVFYMRGILGQYVIAIPALDKIIVRLGHARGEKIQGHYSETYLMIDEAISSTN